MNKELLNENKTLLIKIKELEQMLDKKRKELTNNEQLMI